MTQPETNPHADTRMDQTEAGKNKPADFMVDSAGNVAPSTRRKAESLAGKSRPPSGRWSRPD